VRRLVFLSSVKVNGESTQPGRPFMADDVPNPQDPYSVSKLEAEQGLQLIARQTGLEVVIIRPPLVYGPGVKANFRLLMQCVDRRLPLPLASLTNRRSLVALDNLVDLVAVCLTHPAAANQTLLVSDGEDLSTPDLLRKLGQAMNRSVRLLPLPRRLLLFAGSVVGQAATTRRLCDSLQLDISRTARLLDWSPPVAVEAGLRRTAEAFLREARV
jgi:nucleoside-diphosphate-sugar epimerase